MNFFSISLPAFRVAGGILILLMGLSMLHAMPDRSRHTPEEQAESYEKESVTVVPLAIPLLSGPGAISTTIVYEHMGHSWPHYLLVCAVILSVSLIVLIAMLVVPKIARVLGRTGINVVTLWVCCWPPSLWNSLPKACLCYSLRLPEWHNS